MEDSMRTGAFLGTAPSTPCMSAGRPAWFLRGAAPANEALRITLARLVELIGGHPDPQPEAAHEVFPVHRVARGATLIHEGARADTLYAVHAGSFKCVKTAEDGYEHVLGFAWQGDLLGIDGLARDQYAFAAVALEDSRVISMAIPGLAALRQRAGALDAALQTLIAQQWVHAGEIAEVMAAVSADVRLARFLVQLSARMAGRGQSSRRLLLRMNRRDIANHLGLAHETISRSFRVLAEGGWLRVDNRDVEIVDLEGLKQYGRCTRGVAEPVPHARPPLNRAA
jgi:CRP/FNR family transcriptional regulator, anaerobic regulatory protein